MRREGNRRRSQVDGNGGLDGLMNPRTHHFVKIGIHVAGRTDTFESLPGIAFRRSTLTDSR